MHGKFVAYYRVSTDRQGRSGLGLDAQKKAVADYLNGGRWELAGEFTEIESGKRNRRSQLQAALSLCRRQKAKLIIARLDRLSRNLSFIAALMDAGVEFVAVDNPHANKLTIHILAAVAQNERELIASRTRDALAAAKARGVNLGRYGKEHLASKNHLSALVRARELAPVMAEFEAKGMSARAIANELNARNIETSSGRTWHATTVLRVLRRISDAATL